MRVRPGFPILIAMGLAACSEEPNFDESFAEQKSRLEEQAKAIEQEIDLRMQEKQDMEDSQEPATAPEPE